MDKKGLLSIVVPVFNEEGLIHESVKRLSLTAAGTGFPYELIFVNDGSSDKTLEILLKCKEENPRIKIISFSRNFGHQMAITAGMDNAQGEAIVIIDADLQDPPEVIPELIKKWQEGFEVVHARRKRRFGEKLFKTWTAKIFYRLMALLSNVEIPVDVGDFRLIDRKVLEALRTLREKHRYVRGLVAWLGFKQGFVEYVRDKRYAGETKYSLFKMIRFSLDGISSFSILPLRLATVMGFLSAAFSFLYIFYALYAKYVLKDVVAGWTSVVIAVFFLGGIQLICMGIMGEYIGMLHDEVKPRPLYVIQEIY